MAAQFRDPVLELRRQHASQVRRTDLLKVRLAVPLSVESREAADRGVLTQREIVLEREVPEVGNPPGVAMQVVVRIQMSRGPAHQRVEPVELFAQPGTTPVDV